MLRFSDVKLSNNNPLVVATRRCESREHTLEEKLDSIDRRIADLKNNDFSYEHDLADGIINGTRWVSITGPMSPNEYAEYIRSGECEREFYIWRDKILLELEAKRTDILRLIEERDRSAN